MTLVRPRHQRLSRDPCGVGIDGAMGRNAESSLPERAMTAANTCGDMQRHIPAKGPAFVIAAHPRNGPDGNDARLKPFGSA
jgi:hypothetical protein